MTSATVSMCSTSAAAPRVAADSRRRATAGASRRRHHVASPETRSARAAGTGWTGRETRAVERRPSPARSGDRGVVSRALLGDQEVRPDPTRPTARRVRIPEKSAIVSPRFSLEIPACAARRPTGAVRRLSSRACLSARGRALTGGRANPLDPRSPAGGTRASAPPNAGGRRRPPRSSRRSPSKTRFTTRRSRRGVAPNTAFFARRNARKKPIDGVSSFWPPRGPSSPLTKPCYRRSLFTHSLLTQDKDLWDELEAEANTLTAGAEAGLWDKVQGGMPGFKPGGGGGSEPQGSDHYWDGSEALAESLFGDSANDDRASLQIQKADFTVNSIIDKINRNKVNLRPSYQREYVWTVKTASKLVESLMLNIPIPTMFFHEVNDGGLEVVDGKQRLTSIWSFINGSFPDGSAFKLKGLDVFAEHNDKTFSELPPEIQERILDHPLNVHTIGRASQPDFVFEVFERLNMGATQLNEQELRNCIYQGVYTDLLQDLSNDQTLLRVCRAKAPHLRMKDRELVLRFFAMRRTGPNGMTSPIKAWLNEEIRENKDMTPSEAEAMRGDFVETINLVWDVFGDASFRPVKKGAVSSPDKSNGASGNDSESFGLFYRDHFENGEINVALWDTVMYAFAGRSEEEIRPNREKIMAAFIKLAGSSAFRKIMVSQPKAVVARAEAFGSVMDAICGPRGGKRGAKTR
jgi:hypothetical protein